MKCPQCGKFVELPPPGGVFYCPTWIDYGGCYYRNPAHWNELLSDAPVSVDPVANFHRLWRLLYQGEPYVVQTFADAPRDPLLQEREKTHGSFERNATISQEIKALFYKHCHDIPSAVHNEALDMIALKLSRILSGQANFKDHWDDISGYAKLASEACEPAKVAGRDTTATDNGETR